MTTPKAAPKAIVFDLDGTLIHSAPDLHAAMNVTLAAYGRAPLDLPTVTSFIGNGVEKLVERAFAATGDTAPGLLAEAIGSYREAYDADMTTLTVLYPGVREALARLQGQGVRLAICTNKPGGPARAICAEMDLARHFDVITGAEPGQPKKPDPAPLLDTLAALGCPPSAALYVGDSMIDLNTALNAAVPFRLFSGGYLNAPMPDLPPGHVFGDWAACGF